MVGKSGSEHHNEERNQFQIMTAQCPAMDLRDNSSAIIKQESCWVFLMIMLTILGTRVFSAVPASKGVLLAPGGIVTHLDLSCLCSLH